MAPGGGPRVSSRVVKMPCMRITPFPLARRACWLAAFALASVLGTSEASAGKRILLLRASDNAVRLVGDPARDETLFAVGPGADPVLSSYRRTPYGPRSWPWVLQDLDVRGRAVSRPRPIGTVDRRSYGPFSKISPDGRRIAYAATDDSRRVNRDTGKGPVAVEVAGLRALVPIRVLRDLRDEPALGWSPDDRTLYMAGRRRGMVRDALWSYDVRTRRTVRRALLEQPFRSRELSVGRDGRVLYEAEVKAGREAIVVDLAARTQGRLEPAFVELPRLTGPLGLEDPVLSPAGDTAAALRSGSFGLELLRVDGRAPTPVALPEGELVSRVDWSPDGSVLAVVSTALERPGFVVRFVDPATGAARVVLRRTGELFEPRWSPDGRWYGFTLT